MTVYIPIPDFRWRARSYRVEHNAAGYVVLPDDSDLSGEIARRTAGGRGALTVAPISGVNGAVTFPDLLDEERARAELARMAEDWLRWAARRRRTAEEALQAGDHARASKLQRQAEAFDSTARSLDEASTSVPFDGL